MYMSIIGLGARQGGGAGPTWLKVCLRRDVSTYISSGTCVYAKSYLLDIWACGNTCWVPQWPDLRVGQNPGGAGPIMLSRTGAGRCCGAQGALQKKVCQNPHCVYYFILKCHTYFLVGIPEILLIFAPKSEKVLI